MSYTTDEARWAAVSVRDRRADGAFVYGVVTTGVYCRPGCASRAPKRDNVRYFATPAEAEAAGLRPCKRCSPREARADAAEAAAVARAVALIEAADAPPSLRELAAAAGLSPFHFHRVFKAALRVTPASSAPPSSLNSTSTAPPNPPSTPSSPPSPSTSNPGWSAPWPPP